MEWESFLTLKSIRIFRNHIIWDIQIIRAMKYSGKKTVVVEGGLDNFKKFSQHTRPLEVWSPAQESWLSKSESSSV